MGGIFASKNQRERYRKVTNLYTYQKFNNYIWHQVNH
jgi:hypothetical protein